LIDEWMKGLPTSHGNEQGDRHGVRIPDDLSRTSSHRRPMSASTPNRRQILGQRDDNHDGHSADRPQKETARKQEQRKKQQTSRSIGGLDLLPTSGSSVRSRGERTTHQ
jgi:hypothetical protein